MQLSGESSQRKQQQVCLGAFGGGSATVAAASTFSLRDSPSVVHSDVLVFFTRACTSSSDFPCWSPSAEARCRWPPWPAASPPACGVLSDEPIGSCARPVPHAACSPPSLPVLSHPVPCAHPRLVRLFHSCPWAIACAFQISKTPFSPHTFPAPPHPQDPPGLPFLGFCPCHLDVTGTHIS